MNYKASPQTGLLVFTHFFSTLNPHALRNAVAMVIALGVGCNAIHALAVMWFSALLGHKYEWISQLIVAALCVVSVGAMYLLARRAVPDLRMKVVEVYEPIEAEALILFLSSPRNKLGDYQEPDAPARLKAYFADPTIAKTEYYGLPWLMPCMAILNNAESLRLVVIVPSKETQSTLGAFKTLASSLLGPPAEIVTPGDLIKDERYLRLAFPVEHSGLGPVHGVPLPSVDELAERLKQLDFEDAEGLTPVFHVLWECVEERLTAMRAAAPSRRSPVLIDVTGGQKITSIVGAVAAFGEHRLFQYIRTSEPRRRRIYDISHAD